MPSSSLFVSAGEPNRLPGGGADGENPQVMAFEGRQYRRSELEQATDDLAVVLHLRGVTAGQRVALMSSNRPEFVFALRAIWRLGAAVVLISPAWKRAEVSDALALTRPDHAVGDQPVLAELMPMLSLDDPVPAAAAAAVPAVTFAADDDAVLVFSSGTTGLPKAVRHTHGAFAEAVRHWQRALELGPTDRLQIVTPPSHILGLLNIVTVLEAGGWLRLHRRFDIDALLSHIGSDRITVEMAVAPIALAIAAHPKLEDYDLSSLRYVMWCATPVTASVAEAVTRRSGVNWVTAYGASELPVLTCNVLSDARLDTVGRAVPGVRLRVVSLETGAPVSPGDVGEIQALSNSVMAGYLPEEATAAAFAVSADGAWYRTGDVGYLDGEGWLRITDRAKEMIKVRGFQVAPAEIEAVLHGHPAVRDCAVFGVPHPADGEAVVAAVCVHHGVPADELAELVADRLASYKRLSEVIFVPEIPRLPSGKALRRMLKESYGRTSDK
jgi:long-chain acyl-CoA synthetase